MTGTAEANPDGPNHAFLYDTETEAYADLGALTPGGFSSGFGVSVDGRTVVGSATVLSGGNPLGQSHAFRWTETGGMQDLGTLDGPAAFSRALGISDDGGTVVGETAVPGGAVHAFRWTEAEGMVDLGTTAASGRSIATAATPDGGVIVGGSGRAFRWTDAGGMVDLGAPQGFTNSLATGVSDNGAIVVGNADTIILRMNSEGQADFRPESRPFRWTDASLGGDGMAELNALAAEAGIDLTGFTLISADGISGDGSLIYGSMLRDGATEFDPVSYLLQYCDDFVTDCFGGVVTPGPSEGGAGAAELAQAHRSASVHLAATADVLLGFGAPLDAPSGIGGITAGGSFTAGITGRWTGQDGLSVFGGIARTRQDYDDIDIDGATIVAGGLRYLFSGETLRPFVEAGGWIATDLDLTLRRRYLSGATPSVGVGSASGDAWALYARAGAEQTLPGGQTLTYSLDYTRVRLDRDGYTESASATNPLPASFGDTTQETDIVRIAASFTAPLSPKTDLTASVALGRAFGDSNLTGALAGPVTIQGGAGHADFGLIGLRLDHALNDRWRIGTFVTGIGGHRIDTHWSAGIVFDMTF